MAEKKGSRNKGVSKQADEAMCHGDDRYRILVETAGAGIGTVDIEGNLTSANTRLFQLTGYSKEDVLGRPFADFVHKDDFPHLMEAFLNAVSGTNQSELLEFRLVHKDGHSIWVHGNPEPVIIDGLVTEFSAIIYDISDRKHLEQDLAESEERFRRLSENAPDVIYRYRLKPTTGFDYVSPASANISGYTPEDYYADPSLTDKIVHPEDRDRFKNYFRNLESLGTPLTLRWIHKDGHVIWSEEIDVPVHDANGEIIALEGIARDITERKLVEEALRESEQSYRRLADYHKQLNEASISFSEAADIQDLFNRIAATFCNLTDAIASTFSLYSKENRDLRVVSLSIDPVSSDKVSPIFGPGLFEMRMLVSTDVMEQMLSQVIRRPRDLHELSFGVMPQDISDAVMDAAGCKQIVALALSHAAELVGTCISYLPADRPVVPDDALKTYAYVAGMAVKRKKADDELRESDARYRLISEHTSDSVWLMDMNLKTTYHSPASTKVRGYTPQEIMDLPLDRNLTPASLKSASELFLEELPRVIADPGYNPVRTIDLEYYCKDGTTKWAENKFSIIRDDNRNPVSILGEARDITERLHIESALKESEEKYRLVVENALEAIFIDIKGILNFGNRRTTELTGYSQEEYSSRPLMEFIHPDDRRAVVDRYRQRIKGFGVPNIYTFRIVCKSGNILWVEVSETQITWEGMPANLNFMTDITDRKRLEDEQQRVQKLESIGLLAGGIAHDFNNILTAILGNISLARTEAAPGSEILESLEQAEKASLRARDLTQQLLTFSKGGATVKKLASLTELLRDTVGFALRGSNVSCSFSIPDDLWHAEIDAGQVSQVIHNLAINAQQAMPTGGTIELTAENITLSEEQSLGRGLPLKEGNYVRITVTDHGSGIPAEHLAKIFDPFFTTKQRGSGLGLATSFSIARHHGGHLSVESELGAGSTFYLYLPASMKTSVPGQGKTEKIKIAGKARILVMDDEKGVRHVAGRMLKHIGYEDVEFAVDGAEAVRRYKEAKESRQPFRLVILDLTIPGGMGGREAIKQLLEVDPGVTAIVSSGYADESVMADYKEYGFRGMVVKPYSIEQLGKAVKDVIG